MIHVIAAICGWPEALLFLRIVQRHLPPSLYTNWCLHQEIYLQVMGLSIRWVCFSNNSICDSLCGSYLEGKVREKNVSVKHNCRGW